MNKQIEEIGYKDSDFVSYRKYKEDEFFSQYSKEFVKYKNRNRLGDHSRLSRSFKGERRNKRIRSERLGKYLVWNDFEKEVKNEKEKKEKKEVLLKKELGNRVIVYECPICMETSEEKSQMVFLDCSHVFHTKCLEAWVKMSPGKGEKFSASQCKCPMCRRFISGSNVEMNKKAWSFEKKNRSIRQVLIQSEGIEEDHLKILKENRRMGEVNRIMEKYVFYSCYDCEDLYFGGELDCLQDLQEEEEEEVEGEDDNDEREAKEEEKKRSHVCSKCFVKRSKQKNHPDHCKIHGKEYITYKCRYCCSSAYYFCFGTTHMCIRCHTTLDGKVYKCPGHPVCLGEHVDNGIGEENEQCLGCVLCRVK